MIVLFVVTRNEAELLRLNLAHHLGWGFDHVAIADNESNDATQDVIREFGDAVTATRISDPHDRFLALSRLLRQIENEYGLVDWCGVSDTDEFWWAPRTDIRDLLGRVAKDVVAMTSRPQKLFLPTAADPVAGPVYCRRTYRTSGTKSPLHTSYRAGKSLYRGTWLRSHVVTNPHRSPDIPHGRVSFERPLVHHYMIDGENSFVDKVRSLERWKPELSTASDSRTESRGQTPGNHKSSPIRDFKVEWYRIYEATGEAGLRDYYRREYLISASRLTEYLERGDLVEDSQFADFKRSNPNV